MKEPEAEVRPVKTLFDLWAEEYESGKTKLGLWEWKKEYKRLARDLV